MPEVTSRDGIPLAVSTVGDGAGAGAFFVHATGFCKETWLPVVDRLPGVRATLLDQRGHGASGTPQPPFDWWDLGADVLEVLGDATDRPIGVGHSSGGAAVAMAEITRRGTFSALVLIEPIILPPPFVRGEDNPLTMQALRRRHHFESVDSAFESFHGRGPFARWTDESLRLYVEHGTVESADGGRTLACPPEIEAGFYRAATAHGAWDRLGEIGCPVTVVVGEHSDSHTPEFGVSLTSRFRNAELRTIEGATHFVPMENPDAVADAVHDALT
ncbi:MAG: alpha/beta hydrolase [Acidimicrobiia bacterium]